MTTKRVEAVRSYFCLWQVSSKAYRAATANTWKIQCHFSRCHDSSRATPEIFERELHNRRKHWITHRMSTHQTTTQHKGFASYCEPALSKQKYVYVSIRISSTMRMQEYPNSHKSWELGHMREQLISGCFFLPRIVGLDQG